MSKKRNTNFKPFVIIFILIIAVIIGIQLFREARFETILAAQGEVIDGLWSNVLIVRDEQIVGAPNSGKVELFVGEGNRFASGKKLAEIHTSSDSKKIFNRKAGIISFAVDGLESKINIQRLEKINLNNFAAYTGDYQHLLSGDKIKKNEPLYRIINNFELYLITKVTEEQTEKFRINETIFLKQQNSNKLYKAKITNIFHSLEGSFFYIQVDQFIPEWINRRRIKLNIIKNIYRGIKIPRKAIFSQPSGQGVLKISGYNKYEFKKITIVNGNEKFVIVNGLEIGEEIITNPEDFDYGREV